MISAGFPICAITFAIVNVFPDPVTPSSVWWRFPAATDFTSFAMACAWSPCGWNSELSENTDIEIDYDPRMHRQPLPDESLQADLSRRRSRFHSRHVRPPRLRFADPATAQAGGGHLPSTVPPACAGRCRQHA